MIEDWLAHWLTPQVINTFTAPNRGIFDWIRDWRVASSGSATGPLNPALSPFRLLAILPRVDLREPVAGKNEIDGPFVNAGEARFVFGAVVPPGWPSAGLLPGPTTGGGCKLLPFTVIFEYGVPMNSCPDVRRWANDWRALNTMPYGSPPYLFHLESLTRAFTDRNRDPSKPFGSALNQLRTNENAFDPLWELREFQLDSGPMRLVQTETADNADNMFQDTPRLLSYITDFSNGLVSEVPFLLPHRRGSVPHRQPDRSGGSSGTRCH